MRVKALYIIFAAIITPVFLSSCLGIKADIALNANGSGTISLEYEIAKSLDSLGQMDGNERWGTVPVGHSDFERTLDRLPELRLLSFSSREDERNIYISARLEFTSIRGLLSFLDPPSERSAFSGDAASGLMTFTLSEGNQPVNPALDRFLEEVFRPYSVDISMSFPGQGRLNVTDAQGSPFQGAAVTAGQGRSVSSVIPLYEVISARNGLVLEFSW